MIKVSIIMPSYNVEKYLEQAVRSCLNQSLKDIEIIIVNDGSTDKTGEIARKLMEECSNIVYVETSNQGLSMARNNGMRFAKGEYVYFLDSDDWIEEECLEKCYEQLERYQLDYVTFDVKQIFENEAGIQYKYAELNQNLDSEYIYNGVELAKKTVMLGGLFPAVWKNVYRHSFLENNNLSFVSGIVYEDNPFELKVFSCAQRVKYISKRLHNYRVHENSIMTSKISIGKIESVFFIGNEFLDFLESVTDNEEIWKSYVATRISNICKNIFKVGSVLEVKEIEDYKELILIRKEKLISKISKIYHGNGYSLDDVRNMSKLMNTIVPGLNISNEVYEEMRKDVNEESKKQISDILKKFPLNDNKKNVGIYGSGVNSDYILNLYEQYIGEIRANIIYIDSKIESYTKKHKGIDIINVADLDKTNIEDIIILSFIYEREMYQTIRHLYGNKFKIYRFYENSLVSIC